ncbi:stress response protein AzuC [Dickeya poaceiphila]|uniref:Stress response protein AzuC n=1 Tax=Dickeya poaceiphila TaxID=568768 RepID=A0A5B8HS08_9GAMM|nr:stress response protein AzuC [Dickeya poaceiphila]
MSYDFFCDLNHKNIALTFNKTYNLLPESSQILSSTKVINMRNLLKKLLVAYINAYKDIPLGGMH